MRIRIYFLLPEDVIMNVELLGRLRREHERLHEASHGLAVVGQLAGDLDDHGAADSGLRVHLANFGVAVLEGERANLLVDLELSDHGLFHMTGPIDTAVHERRAARVEAVQDLGRFVQHRVVLANEFSAYLLRTWMSHDHDRAFLLRVLVFSSSTIFYL